MMTTPITNNSTARNGLARSGSSDHTSSASDDFNNLLASLWFAPLVLQIQVQHSATAEPNGAAIDTNSDAPGTTDPVIPTNGKQPPDERPAGPPFHVIKLELANLTTAPPAPIPPVAGDLSTEPSDPQPAGQSSDSPTTATGDGALVSTLKGGVADLTSLLPDIANGPNNNKDASSVQITTQSQTTSASAPVPSAPTAHNSALVSGIYSASLEHELVAVERAAVPMPQVIDPTRSSKPTDAAVPPPLTDSAKATLAPVTNTVTNSDRTVVVDSNVAPTLQEQAAQRDASIVANYLAEATRQTREINPLQSIRRQLAGGSDLHGNDGKHELSAAADDDSSPLTQTSASYAALAREVAGDATTESPVTQSINHILALAETLNVRQIRSLRLSLQPDELGQVEVQLKRDARGNISAHLTAEREGVRQLLSQSLGQLRKTLERAGLSVDRLQVKSEAGSLRSNGNNSSSRFFDRKPKATTAGSLRMKKTEERDTLRVHEDRFLSLSA
jgi:flagellar hook-length control protein FliK